MFAEMFLVDILRNDPGVQAIMGGGGAITKPLRNVGTRISPYRNKESLMPAITYESLGGENDPDLDIERVLIKIRCWDDRPNIALQLSYAVKQALNKAGGGAGVNCNYIYKTYTETADTHEFMEESNKHTVWRVFEFIVQQ